MQKIKFLILFLAVSMFANSLAVAEQSDDKWQKADRSGDKNFVKHNFEKAIACYGKALQDAGNQQARDEMNLKLARIHVMLQRHPDAIKYYESLIDQNSELLTVTDVCNYLDALRRTGDDRKAEIIARKYWYNVKYGNNQRYNNIVDALSINRHYFTKLDSEYSVTPISDNSDSPEFWIGQFEGELFYASSNSPFHDPQKLFYHRSRYFRLTEQKNDEVIERRGGRAAKSFSDYIPVDLQNGPVAINESSSMMIVTALIYNNKGLVSKPGEETRFYHTQLLYSEKDSKRQGWSPFKPLTPVNKKKSTSQNYSDAHPFFFNNDRSLLFVSSRIGGYGGMDIYMAHWDPVSHTWSQPQNLGPAVNTEGDELFPMIQGDHLAFSSNGHAGFGGYDIYKILFENGEINGNVSHFPFPVNSTYNNLMMYPVSSTQGYLVSDRNGVDGIYTYTLSPYVGSGETNYGVSERKAIASGAHEVVIKLKDSENSSSSEAIDFISDFINVTSPSVILTVNFDFNSYAFDDKALSKLQEFIAKGDWNEGTRLRITGYADDMGMERYNQELSVKRAEAVADYLRKGNIQTPMVLTGKGSISLTNQEVEEEMAKFDKGSLPVVTSGDINKILSPVNLGYLKEMNRRARKVDVIIEYEQ